MLRSWAGLEAPQGRETGRNVGVKGTVLPCLSQW